MYLGEPLAPSYVPNMMSTYGDRMSLMERMKNAIGIYMGTLFSKNTFEAEAAVLSANFGKDYTSEIAVRTQSRP